MNKLFCPLSVGAHFLVVLRRYKSPFGLAACLWGVMPAAWAQSERDPLHAQPSAAPVYDSAFSDYQPYRDPEWISWPAANDVVREFGGMAAMKDSGEGGGSAHAGHHTRGGESSKPAPQPVPDVSHTGHGAPAASPSAAPAHSRPADTKPMPGHDMSKMPKTAPSSSAQPSPAQPPAAPKPAAPDPHKSMPGHRGMSH